MGGLEQSLINHCILSNSKSVGSLWPDDPDLGSAVTQSGFNLSELGSLILTGYDDSYLMGLAEVEWMIHEKHRVSLGPVAGRVSVAPRDTGSAAT